MTEETEDQPPKLEPKSTEIEENKTDWQIKKEKIAKIISIVLIVNGVREIAVSLFSIFKYSNAVQAGGFIAHDEFRELLKFFIVGTISSLVETGYGLSLIVKPSEKIKLVHLVLGALIFIIPFLVPDTVLDNVEDHLPTVSLVLSVNAQETSPEQAIADYQFQLQKYREAHQEYLASKNSFLSFKTLNSRTKAINNTKQLLTQRDETIRSYLLALRVQIINSPGIIASQKDQLLNQIAAQEQFVTTHKQQVPSISDIETIKSVSENLEDRYPQIQTVAFQGLSTILVGEQNQSETELLRLAENLETLAQDATDNEINKPRVDQWLKDTRSSIEQNQLLYQDQQVELERIRPRASSSTSNQRYFSKVLSILKKTKQNLLDSANFINEIITIIKYG